MKVISEKREIVGTLSTLVGRFLMLDLYPIHTDLRLRMSLDRVDSVAFHVLNDEGFECSVVLRGDFVVIPAIVNTLVDVKRLATDEEAQLITIPDERMSIVE